MSVARRLFILAAVVILVGLTGGWLTGLALKRIHDLLPAVTKQPAEKPAPKKQLDIRQIMEEGADTATQPLAQVLDNLDYTQDASAFKTYHLVVQSRLRKEGFEELEQYATKVRSDKARFPGGEWKIQRFITTLSKYPGGTDRPDSDWLSHMTYFQSWMKQFPNSITARVAYANALTDYAWKARGSGWASTVEEDGWKRFRERLQQARKVLEELPVARRTCPTWHRAMLTVALGQSWERGEYDQLVQDAIRLEPLFQPVYTARAYSLLPRWHGKEGDWETFAKENADKIGGEAGDALYYYIAVSLRDFYSEDEFFKKTRVSWPRMKRGFAAIEHQSGLNQTQLNTYCRICGVADDRPEALKILGRLGDNWDKDAWGTKATFDDFQDWANKRGKYINCP